MKRRSRQKGAFLAEAAPALLVFLALVIGLVVVGQILFLRQTLIERARTAVRWGAVHRYDETAIRNLVLYGTVAPAANARPLIGLSPADVTVSRLNCGARPSPDCRVKVVIAGYGGGSFAAFRTAGLAAGGPIEMSAVQEGPEASP